MDLIRHIPFQTYTGLITRSLLREFIESIHVNFRTYLNSLKRGNSFSYIKSNPGSYFLNNFLKTITEMEFYFEIIGKSKPFKKKISPLHRRLVEGYGICS